MSHPYGGADAEPDWDNIIGRDRSGDIDDWDILPTRGRGAVVDHGHLAAANNHNRLGVVWLFSKIYVDEKPVWMEDGRERGMAVIAPPTSWQIASETIAGLVKDLVQYIKQKIDAALKYFDDNAEEIIGGAYVASLVASVLEAVWPSWREWVPVAGDAATGLAAIKDTFVAAKALFDSWLTSSCAKVVDGVPSVVVESLRATMQRSLAKGIVEAVQSGLKVSAAFLTAGASSLGEKVVGIIGKVIIKVVTAILKAKERARMRKFCGEAEMHWVKRDSSDAIHKDHKKFVEWYKPVAIAAPAIAAMTLLSHVCGDKNAYLAMYQDRLEGVPEPMFTAAAAAIDSMKPWARSYLNDCGFTFSSTDVIVAKVLKLPDVPPTELVTSIMSEAEAGTIITRSRR